MSRNHSRLNIFRSNTLSGQENYYPPHNPIM